MYSNWTARIEHYLALGLSVSGAKGDATDEASMKSQAAFSTSLQQSFQTQFKAQQGLLNFLNPKMEAMVNNPTGFSPQTLAAATTGNIQNAATGAQSATQAAQAQEAAPGGGLPSGVNAQIQGQINSSAANQLSGNQNSLQIANAQQQQQNYWSAAGALSGDAQMENPNAYAGDANQAASSIASLSQANSAANQVGFMNTFDNAFGGAAGNFLGGGKVGGSAGGFGGMGLG